MDGFRRNDFKVASVACDQTRSRYEGAVLDCQVCRCDVRIGLFVRSQPNNFFCDLALNHFAIRRYQESIFIDTGVDRKRTDQTDVGTFRRFDRANTAVVGNVNVANFEARSLSIQPTWSERRKTAFVSQLR